MPEFWEYCSHNCDQKFVLDSGQNSKRNLKQNCGRKPVRIRGKIPASNLAIIPSKIIAMRTLHHENIRQEF